MAGQAAGLSGSGPPAEPPRDYAGLFAVERDRLTGLLAGLLAADWERPSPCPGWSVLGLCCHLVGDDFGLLARHRDGYYGTPGPGGATEAEFVAWLDELQAEWVRAARRLSPRIVADLLRWAGPQIAGIFRREDARARTASVSWAGAGASLVGPGARAVGVLDPPAADPAGARPAQRPAPTWPGRCSTGCGGPTPAAWPRPGRSPATL